MTGAGRGFSSGADLKSGFDPHPDDGMPDIRKELHELYHPIIAGVRRLEKPVVAAVNGPAVGIGASLAFACDLVLAAESAFFGLAFVNIGLMPDGGSTLFVPTAVGKARAFQMALLGERVPAERALEWGLVNYVYPDDRLMDEANALVEQARGRADPLVRGLEAGPQPDALPGPRRPARPRGGAPARPGADQGLPGGRDRLRREARAGLPGGLTVPAAGARATGAQATGAHAGAVRALGAAALGAVALGAVAIGRLAIRRAAIKQLRIEELEVGRLRVRELEVESGLGEGAGPGERQR